MGSHLVVEARGAAGDVVLTWQFVEAPNRRFFWRALASDGSVSQQSEAKFQSLEDCAADASRSWNGAR